MTAYRRAELARVLFRARCRLQLAADLTVEERGRAALVLSALDDLLALIDPDPSCLGPFAWWEDER